MLIIYSAAGLRTKAKRIQEEEEEEESNHSLRLEKIRRVGIQLSRILVTILS